MQSLTLSIVAKVSWRRLRAASSAIKQQNSLGRYQHRWLDAAGGADGQRCSRPDGRRRIQGSTRPGHRSGSEPAISNCAGSLPSLPGAACRSTNSCLGAGVLSLPRVPVTL
jgi:hypothetical protein